MKLRRILIALFLEGYAVALALLQMQGGVRTDEAKYLLNIPYPHPPLVRFVLSLTPSWPQQELFWRIVLATLLVQGAWIVWSMGKTLPIRDRLSVCGVWLFSAAFVAQAGSIMLVTVTALQGLVFTALFLRRDIDVTVGAGWLALFWCMSLFTALQSILYLPLVVALFVRTRLPRWFQAFCVCAPVLLLLLFIAGHPLVAASFLLVRSDNADLSPLARVLAVGGIWMMAGSIWGSLLGLAGICQKRVGALFLTLLLLSLYAMMSAHDYYALLFLPLFLAGTILFLRRVSLHPLLILAPVLIGTLLLFPRMRPPSSPSPARATMRQISARVSTGTLLIAGPFGHEWEYESRLSILRYHPELLSTARAVVCLVPCPQMPLEKEWMRLQGAPVESWVRK